MTSQDDEYTFWYELQAAIAGAECLRGLLRTELQDLFGGIDPNWMEAEFRFSDKAEKDEPVQVVLNTPKFGDVDVTEKVRFLRPGALQPLTKLMRGGHLSRSCGSDRRDISIFNPGYKIEILDGRTEVSFENCEQGMARNYNSQTSTFEVHMDPFLSGEPEIRIYTIERLKEEMALEDVFDGQAVCLEYHPRLPRRG